MKEGVRCQSTLTSLTQTTIATTATPTVPTQKRRRRMWLKAFKPNSAHHHHRRLRADILLKVTLPPYQRLIDFTQCTMPAQLLMGREIPFWVATI